MTITNSETYASLTQPALTAIYLHGALNIRSASSLSCTVLLRSSFNEVASLMTKPKLMTADTFPTSPSDRTTINQYGERASKLTFARQPFSSLGP